MKITVRNVRGGKPSCYSIYCGRGRAPEWCDWNAGVGNPHPVGYCRKCGRTHTRGEAIAAFVQTAWEQKGRMFALLEHVRGMDEIALVCWCAPDACHADKIRRWLLKKLA